jgi:hypothetical protein
MEGLLEIFVYSIVGIIGIAWWVLLPIVFISWIIRETCKDIGQAITINQESADLSEAKQLLSMIRERQNKKE